MLFFRVFVYFRLFRVLSGRQNDSSFGRMKPTDKNDRKRTFDRRLMAETTIKVPETKGELCIDGIL
jgi:hypothetical protein